MYKTSLNSDTKNLNEHKVEYDQIKENEREYQKEEVNKILLSIYARDNGCGFSSSVIISFLISN